MIKKLSLLVLFLCESISLFASAYQKPNLSWHHRKTNWLMFAVQDADVEGVRLELDQHDTTDDHKKKALEWAQARLKKTSDANREKLQEIISLLS